MYRRALLIFIAFALTGCAANKVSVAYPKAVTPAETARTRAMGNLYLRIRKPKMPQKNLAGKALTSLASHLTPISRLLFPVDAGTFARAFAKRLQRRGAYLVAYKVARTGERDPFVEHLLPAGIAEVRFVSLDLTKKTKDKTVSVRVKNKETGKYENESRTVQVDVVTARLTLVAQLLAHPDGTELASFTHSVAITQEAQSRIKNARDMRNWHRKHEPALLKKAARQLAPRFARVAVVSRKRQLFTNKDEPRSKAARKHFNGGRWERASELWAERLDDGKGDWKDIVNLGVAHEKRREFAAAQKIYKDAQAKAGGAPEAAKIPWQQIQEDLASALVTVGQRSHAAEEWFARPIAVMPFSDTTTSVDGPIMLRELVHGSLRKGGYNVPDIIEVDHILHNHGISQGGQLKAKRAAEYATWLGTDRLIFGHLERFNEIMLGAFGRRTVAGKLSLFNPDKGFLWSSDERAITEEAAKSGNDVVGMFAGQLLRGLFERIANKPLGTESALFVRQNIETLPLKP
jgi:hypothetical protein